MLPNCSSPPLDSPTQKTVDSPPEQRVSRLESPPDPQGSSKATADAEAPQWTPRRRDLLEWFRRNAPPLGELYEGAVQMLHERRPPGHTRFVAHAIREIGNRLPDVIAGKQERSNLGYKNRLDQLLELWEKLALPLDGSLPRVEDVMSVAASSTPSSSPLPRNISFPEKLFLNIAGLLRDHANTREKRSDAAIRLFQTLAPENNDRIRTLRPYVEQWLSITQWAVGVAHSYQKTDDAQVQAVHEQFELFEASLMCFVTPFFGTIDEINAVLEDANS